MSLPYRLAVRATPLSRADALTLSAERGASNAGRIEESAAALQRIREAKSAVDDRLRSWIFHPDEAVAAAILENPSFQSMDSEQGGLLLASLYMRAIDDAKAEGLLWNPLLDQLADTTRHHYGGYQGAQSWGPSGSYRFNQVQQRLAQQRGVPNTVEVLSPTGLQIRPMPDDFATAIAPLVDWAAQQTDPATVRPLITRARSGLVRARIGAVVPSWTLDDLARLFQDADPKTVTHICRNTTALAAHGRAVWDLIVPTILKNLNTATQHNWNILGQWEERLKLLTEAVSPAPEQMEQLADGMLSLVGRNDMWARHHMMATAIQVLGTHLPVSAHHRLTIGLKGMSTYDREKLILHPQTTPALLEELLATHSDFPTRKLVARASGRVRSPAVRDGLAKSSSPLIAGPLVPGETQPRRFQSLWRKAIAKTDGIEALTESLLDPKDWQAGPLLSQGRMLEAMAQLPLRPDEAQIEAEVKAEGVKQKLSNYYLQHQLSQIKERRDRFREFAAPRLLLTVAILRRLDTQDETLPPLDPALVAARPQWESTLARAWENWQLYHAYMPESHYSVRMHGDGIREQFRVKAMIEMLDQHPDQLMRFVDRPFLKSAMLSPEREVRTTAMGLLTRVATIAGAPPEPPLQMEPTADDHETAAPHRSR